MTPKQKTLAACGLSLVAAVALGWALWPYLRPGNASVVPDMPKLAYFFDPQTGTLFTANAAQPSVPIVNPQTPGAPATAVYAHVFSCTSCDDEKSRFVGYIERPNPNALGNSPSLFAPPVAAPGGLDWSKQSDDPTAFEQQADRKCRPALAVRCQPL